MENFTRKRGHPQPTLIPFYWWSRVYLIIESFIGLIWIGHMLVLKILLNRADGAQYRALNEATLFHFTASISMWAVISSTSNDNSVSWWAFVPIFVSFGNDLSTLLSVSLQFVDKAVPWAWGTALAQCIIQIIVTFIAIAIYSWFFVIRRPRDLPTSVAFRKGKLRKPDNEEPLLDKKL